MSQTGIGGAFEFALGEAFSQCLGVPLQELSKSPRKYYNTSREKLSMDQAATKATDFLLINDKTLAGATSVILRSNKAKTNGDVRGVIIRLLNQSVGVSAKTRHKALKHPGYRALLTLEKSGPIALLVLYIGRESSLCSNS